MKRKNNYLGDNIYDWRKQNKISQEDFAEMVGVTRQTVLKWEAGTVMPQSDKLQQISEIIGIGLEQLISNSNTQSTVEIVAAEAIIESEDVGKSKDKKVKLSEKAKTIIVAIVILSVLLVGILLIVYDKVLASSNSNDGTVGTVEIVALNFSVENVGWILFGTSLAVSFILGVTLICKLIKSKKKGNNVTNGNEPK